MRPFAFISRTAKYLAGACIAALLVGSPSFASTRPGGAGSSGGGSRHRATGAPEIDPGLAVAGIVVLIGGTLVLTGRRRPATR